MKGKPEKQHWVPHFYLRYFATPETRDTNNPQAWIFSKDAGDPIIVNLKKVAAQRYLYSPKDHEGKRDWKTDDKLTHLEYVMGFIWPSVANDFIGLENGSLRKGLSLFISTLYLRHPANIDLNRKIHRKLIDLYETLPKDAEGNLCIDTIMHEGKEYKFINSGYNEYKTADKNEFKKMFINSLNSNAIPTAKILMEKRWSIIFSDKPVFITTDKPVVTENLEKLNFGLKTKGTIIMFPLSPTRLLVMDDRQDQPNGRYYPLGEQGPGPFNLGLWSNAKQFMISPRHTDDVCTEMLLWADKYQKNDNFQRK